MQMACVHAACVICAITKMVVKNGGARVCGD